MNVLFKNIPIGMKDYELAEYIESNFNIDCIDNMSVLIRVGGIQMLEREDNFTHPIEQFGIVRIAPQAMAEKVIQQFNRNILNKYQITVRAYFDRLETNDRRIISLESSAMFFEHREVDRRKHNLIYSRQI